MDGTKRLGTHSDHKSVIPRDFEGRGGYIYNKIYQKINSSESCNLQGESFYHPNGTFGNWTQTKMAQMKPYWT